MFAFVKNLKRLIPPVSLGLVCWSIFGLVVFSSCDKDDDRLDYSAGVFTASLNGVPWRGQLRMVYSARELGIDVAGFIIERGDEFEDSVGFSWVPTTPGTYNFLDTNRNLRIPQPSCHHIQSTGKDYGIGPYFSPVNRAPGDFIKVVSFDSATTELVAEFNVTLYRNQRDSNYVRKAGDTVVITNGRIEGRIW